VCAPDAALVTVRFTQEIKVRKGKPPSHLQGSYHIQARQFHILPFQNPPRFAKIKARFISLMNFIVKRNMPCVPVSVFSLHTHVPCVKEVKAYWEDTSSPPSSIPNPFNLTSGSPMRGLSLVGGCKLSKLSRRRASLAASGVFAAAGVRAHAA
jgi:hypothetical protein